MNELVESQSVKLPAAMFQPIMSWDQELICTFAQYINKLQLIFFQSCMSWLRVNLLGHVPEHPHRLADIGNNHM